MKFSVIIPVYNCEKTLHISVESIMAQTFQDWELILVNDGSSDNSRVMCNEYAVKDSRIQVVNQNNAGPASARNSGMQHAKGEYLFFCDADDYLVEQAFEVLVGRLGRAADIVFFGYSDVMIEHEEFVVINQHQLNYRQIESNEDFKKEFLALDKAAYTYPVWNKVYRTEFVKECGAQFPSGVNIAEDFVFNIQLYTRARYIVVLDYCFYNYIHHKNSITNSFKASKMNNIEYVYLYTIEHLGNWHQEMRNRLHNAYIRDISVFINNMFNEGVDLTFGEKRELVKEIMRKDSVHQCITNICCTSNRNRVVTALLKYRCINLLLLTGKIARLR